MDETPKNVDQMPITDAQAPNDVDPIGRQVPPDGCVLTTAEAAAVLGVPVKTMEWWRRDRTGPVVMHIGRHCRYRSEDLRAWLAEQAEAGRAWMAS